MRNLSSAVSTCFIGAVLGLCARGQQLGIYLSTSFDPSSGSAYAYAQTTTDYATGYYYYVCTQVSATGEEDNGNENGYFSSTVCDATDAQVSWSFAIPTDTDDISFTGQHSEWFDYQTYQFDPNCGYDGYSCYSYWDAFEMSYLGIGGEGYSTDMLWYLPGPPAVGYGQSEITEYTNAQQGTFCWYPRSEVSAYNWIGNEPTYYTGVFYAQLDNFSGLANYTGRNVGEGVYITSSTCWFVGSPFDEPTTATLNDSGIWPIFSGNSYGADYIGVSKAEADYYQGLLGGGQSCYDFTATQIMSISSCQGGGIPTQVYDPGHTISFDILSNAMIATRASASGPAK